MKKIVFIFLISIILSCNKDKSDILTSTTWSNNDITLSFYENQKVSKYSNSVLDWTGVYTLYGKDYVLIYKPVPGKENWPLEYTGILLDNQLTLNDTIVLNKH
jgi:hypothetical protein